MGQSVHPTGFRLIKFKNWENRECAVEKERYIESLNFQRSVDGYIENFFSWVLYKKILRSIKKKRKRKKVLKLYRRYLKKEIRKDFIKKFLKKQKLGKKKRSLEWLVRLAQRVLKVRKRLWVKRKKRMRRNWRRKCQFRRPTFLYSHTVFLKRNGKLELNVILYVRLKGRITGYNRSYKEKRWKKLLERLLEARLCHNFFKEKEKFQLKIHYIKGPWLNASLCARYVLFLLKRRKGRFGAAVGKLLERPEYYGAEKHNLYGIFIEGAGRFTKRQRASYRKNQRGRVPYSTLTAPVQYAERSVPLKYGACSVKVWICHLRS